MSWSLGSKFTCADFISLQTVCMFASFVFGDILFSSCRRLSFSLETECKRIVVVYSCLLLCLEQTLPFMWQSSMAWNMLHGLKTKERENNQEIKTQQQTQKQHSDSFKWVVIRQAESSFHKDIDKTILTRGALNCLFSQSFQPHHMVFFRSLVCSLVMKL